MPDRFLFIVDPIDSEPYELYDGELEPGEVVSMFVRALAHVAERPGWVLHVRQISDQQGEP